MKKRLCVAAVTHLLLVSLQDNDTCEEWERHEALHEDVTKQDRVEERLFEEEIELKWVCVCLCVNSLAATPAR